MKVAKEQDAIVDITAGIIPRHAEQGKHAAFKAARPCSAVVENIARTKAFHVEQPQIPIAAFKAARQRIAHAENIAAFVFAHVVREQINAKQLRGMAVAAVGVHAQMVVHF